MNASARLDDICQRVVNAYFKVYGDKVQAVFLYGSYARGDFDEASDIDFAAIVDGTRTELQKMRSHLWNEANKLDLEYDILTSPMVIPLNEFEKYKEYSMYYQNIEQEGKRIG